MAVSAIRQKERLLRRVQYTTAASAVASTSFARAKDRKLHRRSPSARMLPLSPSAVHCPAIWQCTRLCVRSAPFRKAKLGQPLDGVSEGTATEFGFAEMGCTHAKPSTLPECGAMHSTNFMRFAPHSWPEFGGNLQFAWRSQPRRLRLRVRPALRGWWPRRRGTGAQVRQPRELANRRLARGW